MKFQRVTNRFFLLFLPILLTGCYTQFQTFDQFPLDDRTYSSNYSWDEYEGSSQSIDQYDQEAVDSEAEVLEQQLALEEMGIYYQDYETKQWYKDHYADKLYWQGYQDGYDDGYFDGWANNGYFPGNNYWYGYNHYRYYNPYHRKYMNPRFYAAFGFGYGSFFHTGYYGGYYNTWGYYSPYYYDYYWGHPHYNYHVYYNAYHWNKKYRREADLYRKGPRNSGLVNRGDVRTRGGNGLTRGNNSRIDSRGTGVTRSRGTTGSRVRGTTGSSSVGRSTSGTVSRTKGSAVGKTRSTNSGSRSRGNGSSVGKRSSNGDSGKSRSRGGNNYQSTFGQTSVRDINISDIRNRTYTIPPRHVQRTDYSSRRFFNIGDIFNSQGFDRSTFRNDSRSPFNTRFNSNTRSSTNSRSVKSSSSRSSSRSVNVTRSSSSNRSSGTKSRSSSSSKRSRGGN